MTQRVIDKIGDWKGLNTHDPPHTLDPMECQQGRNFNINENRIESDRGFKKVWNTTEHQAGLFFPDPNAGLTFEDVLNRNGRVAYARIPHSTRYGSLGTSWTVEIKVQINSNYRDAVDPVILSKGDDSAADRAIEIYLDSSRRVRVEYDTSAGAESVLSTGAIALDTPTMISVVRDGTDLTIYLNGVDSGSGTVNAAANDTNTKPLILGARLLSGESDGNVGPNSGHVRNNFHGIMDELRIWTTNRSSAAVLSEIDKELDSADNTGLGGYWKMNEGTGIELTDEKYTGVGTDTTGELKWIGPQRVDGLVDAGQKGAWQFDGYGTVGVMDDWYNGIFAGPTFPGPYTVEMNVKPTQVSVEQTLCFKGVENSTAIVFHLRITSANRFEFRYWDGSTVQAVTDTNITVAANTHYHVAFGRSATTGYGWLRVWDITNYPDAIALNGVATTGSGG